MIAPDEAQKHCQLCGAPAMWLHKRGFYSRRHRSPLPFAFYSLCAPCIYQWSGDLYCRFCNSYVANQDFDFEKFACQRCIYFLEVPPQAVVQTGKWLEREITALEGTVDALDDATKRLIEGVFSNRIKLTHIVSKTRKVKSKPGPAGSSSMHRLSTKSNRRKMKIVRLKPGEDL